MDAQRSTSPLIVRQAQQPPVAAVRAPVAEAAPVVQLPVFLALPLRQAVAQRPLLHRHPRQRQVEADRAGVVVEADKVAAVEAAAARPE
jgi:hypothetical protein